MNDKKQASIHRLLGFIGLCRRAGALLCGTPQVCEGLASARKPALVIASAQASDATRKKLRSKSAYYSVPLSEIDCPPETLAHAIGKTGAVAAVAVTDPQMAKSLSDRIEAARSAMHPGEAGILISTEKEPSSQEGKEA